LSIAIQLKHHHTTQARRFPKSFPEISHSLEVKLSNSPKSSSSSLLETEVRKPKQPTNVKKGLLMSAGFYPIATGIMQMGKGMTANPALVTMSMIVLLAVTRSILSQQMSTKKTLDQLRATPIKAYQSYLFDLILTPIHRHTQDYLSKTRTAETSKFVYRNPILRDKHHFTDDQSALLFRKIRSHQDHENNIFFGFERQIIGDNEANVNISLDHVRKIYQIKSALIEIDFTKDFPDSPNLNRLDALQQVIHLIEGGLDGERENIPPSVDELISAIQTIADENDESKERVKQFLSEFALYIENLLNSIPDDKTKKDKKEIIAQIYNCVLLPELDENDRLIRSRTRTVLCHIIPKILFLTILFGNAATFTIFTQRKGEEIVSRVLQLLDHRLLGTSAFLSTIPPLAVSFVVGVIFSLSTFLISWYFGGDCVKSVLDKIVQRLERLSGNDNQIKRAYDDKTQSKDMFWTSLLLGTLIAFGSSMVLFDFIRSGDAFSNVFTIKKIPIGSGGQYFLIVSIFLTQVCLFQVLFNNLLKKYIPAIKERCLYVTEKDEEGNLNVTNQKRSLLFIGLSILALLLIVGSLCYVLVVSDISNAPAVFKGYGMNNKYAILISAICVGIFSAVFNVIYSAKALNYIHEKGIALWNESTTANKTLLAFSVVTFSATLVLISLPSSLESLGFSLVASTAMCFLMIASLLSKPVLNHVRNKYGNKKVTLLKNSVIFGLSVFLFSESILINQQLIGKNVASHMYDWSLRITAITLCIFIVFKLAYKDDKSTSSELEESGKDVHSIGAYISNL
jgi:predicted transcriptional regulator